MEKEEITKSRTVILLAELKIELALKERDLRNQVEDNSSAWNMYGSELCAGELEKRERAIKDHIDSLKEQIDILSAYIDGKIIRADGEGLIGIIKAIDEQIVMLSRYRKEDEIKLRRYSILEKLLE
jgi:hypothetical protein